MKKSFGARRVPRKVGTDDDGDEQKNAASSSPAAVATGASDAHDQSPTVVKRPANRSRKSTALRASFTPSQFDDEDDASSVVIPKRSNSSRLTVQRIAEKRPVSDLSFRALAISDSDRPSYSKHHLEELKQSTPSTPKDQSFRGSTDAGHGTSVALNIASKFGADLSAYQLPTAIPTDAEIKEKKERRARLAKEQNFISLEDDQGDDEDEDDDENVTRDEQGRLILKPKEKYAETRLVRDDEDMLEGFDDFTTDSRIGFGNKAESEAAAKRKAEMASLIADAEGDGNSATDDDDSDAERNAAFEIAQTRHGNYGSRDDRDQDFARPQTPPKIAPLPTMDAVVERLRKKLEEMESARMSKTREMQRLVGEKATIGEEEVRVQAALKETGERYSQLRDDLRRQQDERAGESVHGNNVRSDLSSQSEPVAGAHTPEYSEVGSTPRAGLGAQ